MYTKLRILNSSKNLLTAKLVKRKVNSSQIEYKTMFDKAKLHVIRGFSFSCNVLNKSLPQTH